MTGPRGRSLRLQLAALGLVPALVALVVLLAVTVGTEQVSIEIDAEGRVVAEEDRGVSPWVPATAAAMVLAASVAAWWWAGRVTRPIRAVADLADRTTYHSMDRRLRMTGQAAEVQTLADGVDGMLDRIAAAGAVQRRLAEDASHELRTPLAVLATTADVVLARPGATAEEFREATMRMRSTVDRMAATVDTLLSGARAGHVTSRGDLAELVRRVAGEHAESARVAGVEMTVVGPEPLPASFDAFGVERAVSNLVANAVRHSPRDSTVTVEVGAGEGRAFVSVTDQGPGIPVEDQEQVFQRYWRGDEGGTGIGLAIVRLVGEAHEGVEVRSPLTPEGGTRFSLWFRSA